MSTWNVWWHLNGSKSLPWKNGWKSRKHPWKIGGFLEFQVSVKRGWNLKSFDSFSPETISSMNPPKGSKAWDAQFEIFVKNWMGLIHLLLFLMGAIYQSKSVSYWRIKWNTRWWFHIFFIFTPSWGRFQIWLIFFKWVETTNQNMYSSAMVSQYREGVCSTCKESMYSIWTLTRWAPTQL